MITVEELLADESTETPEPEHSKRHPMLRRPARDKGAIKLISREGLLQHDGDDLIKALYNSLLDRNPNASERNLSTKLMAGEVSKNEIYAYVVKQAGDRWWPISGRGWMMDTASAESLTFAEWFNFSLRFFWFRVRGR